MGSGRTSNGILAKMRVTGPRLQVDDSGNKWAWVSSVSQKSETIFWPATNTPIPTSRRYLPFNLTLSSYFRIRIDQLVLPFLWPTIISYHQKNHFSSLMCFCLCYLRKSWSRIQSRIGIKFQYLDDFESKSQFFYSIFDSFNRTHESTVLQN